MRLVSAIRNAILLLAIVLLNSVSFAGHSTAMSTTVHEKGGGMGHGSMAKNSCATLCRTGIVDQDKNTIKANQNEEDNKPIAPFYAENQYEQLDGKSIKQSLYAAHIKPPPKIPIYILYGVFRI